MDGKMLISLLLLTGQIMMVRFNYKQRYWGSTIINAVLLGIMIGMFLMYHFEFNIPIILWNL